MNILEKIYTAGLKLLRRIDSSKLQVADLELNKKIPEVKRAGRIIQLTPKEFMLMKYLMSNKNRVLTREMILNKIWFYSSNVETRTVDACICYLKKKIDKGFDRKLIHSVRGSGYTIIG